MHLKRYRHLHNNMGSISHGTMRPEDLIPAFIDCLESQSPIKRKHRTLISEIQSNLSMDSETLQFYWDSDEPQEHLDSLFDALNEYCLPYFYFGAHPGDGADYGFWLSEVMEREFEGLKQSSNGMRTTGDEIPKGYTGEVLYTNDHGNMTLYYYSRGRCYEVWSVV